MYTIEVGDSLKYLGKDAPSRLDLTARGLSADSLAWMQGQPDKKAIYKVGPGFEKVEWLIVFPPGHHVLLLFKGNLIHSKVHNMESTTGASMVRALCQMNRLCRFGELPMPILIVGEGKTISNLARTW